MKFSTLALFVAVSSASAMERLPAKPPIPGENPMSDAKVALGAQLYMDPRLSKDSTISCNSCHAVGSGGMDGQRFSKGVGGQLGGRNSPTVLNAAYMSVQFWDGRAKSLEEQAKGPMTNPVEMAMPNHDAVVERLKKIPGYVSQFKAVFGGTEKDDSSVTIDNAAKAIAAFERTLVTPNSPVDRFLAGDKKALNAAASRGMKKVEEIGCLSCHTGPNFAGPQLPEGNGFYQKFPLLPGSEYDKKYGFSKDLGRYEVTKNDADKNLWRVPTWRNVALTAPYFHNGAVTELDEAVRVMAKTQLNRDLKDAEVADIVAFLKALTGKQPAQSVKALPNPEVKF